jgi:hypothetical protein
MALDKSSDEVSWILPHESAVADIVCKVEMGNGTPQALVLQEQ